MLIVLENTPYSAIIGSSSAPYINGTLLSSSGVNAGLATNYHAGGGGCQHPSLPNYMEMTAGTATHCDDTVNVGAESVDNIFHQLGAGESASYMEDMSGNCSTSGGSGYSEDHNVELTYANVASDCQSNDVPFTSSSAPPNVFSPKFSLVVPNGPHQGESGGIASADQWLSGFIPSVMATPAYQAGNTAVLVVWDEDDGSEGNRVPLIEIRPGANGFRDNTDYPSHASLLGALEHVFGLPALGEAAGQGLSGNFGL